MSQSERRRGRRVEVRAPLLIRRVGTDDSESFLEEVAQNVSLEGIYFRTSRSQAYAVDDLVIASVSLSDPQTRVFPFSRLFGRGRVVRVSELPQKTHEASQQVGIAVTFGPGVTALTAIPSQT